MTVRRRHVYAITDGDFVKVGLADSVTLRLGELQTANARELRAVWATVGDARLERHLHRALDQLHVRGEWFDLRPMPDAEVAAMLDRIADAWMVAGA